MDSAEHPDLDQRAREFLAAAWDGLEAQHVVPPPRFHPFLQVGTDYFGRGLDHLPEYKALESAITAAHPRFGDDTPLPERAFAGQYVYSFLETAIAELTLDCEAFSTTAAAVDRAVSALKEALKTVERQVACCRVVTHLTTLTGGPVDVAGVTVQPIARDPRSDVFSIIRDVIPGADSAFGRQYPLVYGPPESVVVVREQGKRPFDASALASGKIEDFLLALRLLHAGTSDSLFEVRGETAPVREHGPTLERFRGDHSITSRTQMLRRETAITSEDDSRFTGLHQLINAAKRDQPGMAFTSFVMAMQKFVLSYHAHAWYEQVVDLSTAFEAALSGAATTDVTLRLCNRAAALLVTERDPATAIFDDIKVLYDLRSTLVHGGSLTHKALRRKVYALSTVPTEEMYGIALGYLVDRLRDLVRRSLLMRICLAARAEPLWPLGSDDGVDSSLADEATRQVWRDAWRSELARIGATSSADRPRSAVRHLAPYSPSAGNEVVAPA
jgi:hypothetical protein